MRQSIGAHIFFLIEWISRQLAALPVLGRVEFRVLRYLAAGGLIFAINLVLATVAFALPGAAATHLSRNVTNAIVVEVMILVAYIIHSSGTWHERSPGTLVSRLLRFHVVSLVGVGLRMTTFYGLDLLGAHWLVSTIGSIAVVVSLNFFGYDRLVFGRGAREQS